MIECHEQARWEVLGRRPDAATFACGPHRAAMEAWDEFTETIPFDGEAECCHIDEGVGR